MAVAMIEGMCSGFQNMELVSPEERIVRRAELVEAAWVKCSCNDDFIPADAGLPITLDILARTNPLLRDPEDYAECLEMLRLRRRRELTRVRAEVLWDRIGESVLDTRMELGPELSEEHIASAWLRAWGRRFPKGFSSGTISLTRRRIVTIEQFTFSLECVFRGELGRQLTNSERKHVARLALETYSNAYREAPWNFT